MKPNPEIFKQLKFKFPLRKYQTLILNRVISTKDKESKVHIVAPPGSGKTIVGLELIKQFAYPAVVFTPTSTIQLQWQEKTAMFIPPELSINREDLTSLKPDRLAPINIYTYQLLSSPAENQQFAEEAAIEEWKEQLVVNNTAASRDEAGERIQQLKQNNKEAYTKEKSKYYKKVKDEFLSDPEFDIAKFLHPNAQKLIDDLAEFGVKVIIMDEAHHLLDYWAIVIKALCKKIDKPILIGLTATPPLSADDEELQNYLSIMGDIDFEIPTPAVVKEGNLAPYQDLIYFCTPTSKEKEFITTLQDRFQELIENIGKRETFIQWVSQRIIERKLPTGKRQDWTAFFNSHLFLAIAGTKYIEQFLDQDLPWDIIKVQEMEMEMNIDDWAILLADYSLNLLKVSNDPEKHKELDNITHVLRSFGYTLTESGIRQQRSPADKILAFSQAKNDAVVKILQTEMKSMKEELRAVVITDFEKESATQTKALEHILDEDSGGAVKVFRDIAQNMQTTKLEPVLVTGSNLLLDSDTLPAIKKQFETWKTGLGLEFSLEFENTQYEKIVKVVGKGPDWKSNTYVRMVTELFDKGTIKCIVGTRALLGEGWDTVTLNTLIDLTQATTSTTVNQIRGRSIRLNPERKHKVANNWDIVCIDPQFEKGDQDFKRFLNKHQHFYGLGAKGMIVKGFLHVDATLGMEYNNIGFKQILYHLVNKRMLTKAQERDKIYKEWQVGEAYSNFEYAATKLDITDTKFRTVYQLRDTLLALFNNILAGAGTFIAYYVYFFQDTIPEIITSRSPEYAFIVATIFVLGVLATVTRNCVKYIQRAYIEIPIDSFVLDIGKSLVKSLREAGLIEKSQSVDNVRVVKDESNYYDLYLDYATKQDAQLFTAALNELLSPVTNQRYLVSRSIDNIKLGFYSPIWWMMRKIFRLIKQKKIAYHPVPNAFSVNRKRADIFARNWKEYVGGGDLIYSRSDKGAQLLLKLRRHNAHKIKKMNYEVWK